MFAFDFKTSWVKIYEFDEILEEYDRRNGFRPAILVKLTSKGDRKNDTMVLPKEEGVIQNRVFWLKEWNLEKADTMIENYKKSLYLRLKEKADKVFSEIFEC